MAAKKSRVIVSALIWILVLGGLGALGYWYVNKPKEKPPEFRTVTVTRGDIVQAVTASGQLNPVVNVQVGSQISGIIQELHVDFNSSVTQGQIVAKLDPATFKAAVNQAEGDVANANAALELAQVEARRAGELLQSKLIATSDYDKAMAELHQSEAQVKIREAVLEKARVDFNRCTILAPTNGIVISRNVDVGQTVAASFSAPILFLIANDLRRMQIDAMVSEADIGGVDIDQSVTFTVDAYPTRTFFGKVIQIRNSPATNQNVVTYDTVIAVENRDLKLKPGMTANVSIVSAEQADVLKMPSAALRFRPPEVIAEQMRGASGMGMRGRGEFGGRRGGGGPGRGSGSDGERRPRGERANIRTVYTLASTNAPAPGGTLKPEPKQVRLGISDGMFTEVLEGLKEGDIVVVGSTAQENPLLGRQGGSANPFGGGGRRGF